MLPCSPKMVSTFFGSMPKASTKACGVDLADLVDDELVEFVHGPAQRELGGDEGLGRQLHAFDQQHLGVGDHAVEVAAAQAIPLGRGAGDAAAVARCPGRQFGAGQHHAGGAAAEGQGGHLVAELFLGDVNGSLIRSRVFS